MQAVDRVFHGHSGIHLNDLDQEIIHIDRVGDEVFVDCTCIRLGEVTERRLRPTLRL
jgi:hypothetical protein